MSYLVNSYRFADACDGTTWQQLTYNVDRPLGSTYDFVYGVLIETATMPAGNVCNVQIRFGTDSGDGTVSCCRWADHDDFTQLNGAACVAAADHTYWSVARSTVSDEFYGAGVTSQSTPLANGNIVGIAMTGVSSNSDLSMQQPPVSGYTSYAWDGSVESRSLCFIITTDT